MANFPETETHLITEENQLPRDVDPIKILFVKPAFNQSVKYSKDYSGPGNAAICLGIRDNSLRVAYAPTGGITEHMDLLPMAAPLPDYKVFRAVLRSNLAGGKKERALVIYGPDTDNGEQAPLQSPFNADPRVSFREGALVNLCRKLGAEEYIFRYPVNRGKTDH